MSISKAWNWKEEKSNIWLQPSEESYFIANTWKQRGVKKVLDLGCGLGRHSILFAKTGFQVSALDLSVDATNHLKKWAKDENLAVDVKNADMLNLPYEDNTFDALFAMHVISHTDTENFKKILNEMTRVLKVGSQIFVTLCSKDTWSFKDSGYPKHDENTVIKIEDGPENGIPHFYVTLDDILILFKDFEIERIRHIDDCYFDNAIRNSKHYFITAKLKNKI